MKGTIKALRDGFGFVTMEGAEKDMFFHANNLEGTEFNDLEMGQTLSYELGEGRDGRQQAVNVQLVEGEAA
jgi:CspA family cold shock protein